MSRRKIHLSPLLLLAIGLFFSLIFVIVIKPLLFHRAQIAVINSGPQRYIDAIFSSVNTTKNISYGPDVMDIYEPVGDTAPARAAIIWIHGGGFGTGDKSTFSASDKGYGPDYARYGYVSFAINYQLDSRSHRWNEPNLRAVIDPAVADTHAALSYIIAHASEYRIDPNQIVVAGTSAGAVTALYASYNHPPHPISAVVSIAGTVLPDDLDIITPLAPPTIMIHGELDTTVPFHLTQSLAQRLTTLGVPSLLQTYPRIAHAVSAEPTIHNYIRPFLASHLSASTTTPTPTCRPRPNCDANNLNCDYTIAVKLDGSVNWCPLPSPPSSPLSSPNCLPLPACVNDHPPCDLANANWCPRVTPSPSVTPTSIQTSGLFNITYGDSQNGQSSTVYTLTTLLRVNTNTPTSYHLSFPASLVTSLGGLLQFNNKLVNVSGTLAISNPPTIQVATFSLTASPSPTLVSPSPIISSPVPPTTSKPTSSPSPLHIESPRATREMTPGAQQPGSPLPMLEDVSPSNLPQLLAELTPPPSPLAPTRPSFWQRLLATIRNLFSH